MALPLILRLLEAEPHPLNRERMLFEKPGMCDMEHATFRVERMTDELRARGERVGVDRVRRLMREMGPEAGQPPCFGVAIRSLRS